MLWAALTALGEAAAWSWRPFPVSASDQAAVVDHAFLVLLYMAVPVLAFVVAGLIYSALRFRRAGEPTADGPGVASHPWVIGTWLGVTTALTLAITVYPGVTGLLELGRLGEHEDMVVQVEAMRFAWRVTYPGQNVKSSRELVLPVGRRVRFDVTSRDVIHSFWIPAFRVKIDAVPGKTTQASITPNRVGSYEEDPAYRVQCAELCGLGHALMRMPVRVVEADEFEAWVKAQGGTP